jgi:polar amino acid transport system ATP-binding protein
MSGQPVIELREVTKAFGEREVLKGIDLGIEEHQAVALIGASGSGKSTLLRCIDLLIEIDDGDVFLDGDVITDPSVDPVAIRRKLGFVFQAYNLFPHLNVIDNVTLGMKRAYGLSREEAEDSARRMLARFGLEGRELESSSNLSGGQQQRVAIARAFAARPRAMLLDEVTSALDPELVGEVLRAVRDLKDEGVTMLIATHEMGFAREVADVVGFLHEGRLVEVGPPEQVLESPQAPETQRFLRRLLEAGRA